VFEYLDHQDLVNLKVEECVYGNLVYGEEEEQKDGERLELAQKLLQ